MKGVGDGTACMHALIGDGDRHCSKHKDEQEIERRVGQQSEPRSTRPQPWQPWRCDPSTHPSISHLVVLTPVDIGAASHTRSVQHMRGLHLQAPGCLRRTAVSAQVHTRSTHAGVLSCCNTKGRRPHPVEVGKNGGAVLQAGAGVLEVGALLLEHLTNQAACNEATQGVQSGPSPTQSGDTATQSPHRSSHSCRRSGTSAGRPGRGEASVAN